MSFSGDFIQKSGDFNNYVSYESMWNLCENEILFHLQRKYGNLEQPIFFWGENGVTFFWSFCFFHIRNPLQSVEKFRSNSFLAKKKEICFLFLFLQLVRCCNQQPESNSALSSVFFCRNFTALCPQRCSDVSRHLAYKDKEEGTALFVA